MKRQLGNLGEMTSYIIQQLKLQKFSYGSVNVYVLFVVVV